jgi:S-adenosylmethionine decarboxylase
MHTLNNPMDYGNHIILDLYECDESKLYFSNHNILAFIDYLVKSNYGTIESSNYHIFPNDAYTIMVLLSESHLTIHTFPENKYVSIDIYTCGSNVLTFNIATNIIQYFCSDKPIINHIIRNNFNNCVEVKYNPNDYMIKKDNILYLLHNVLIIKNEKNNIILLCNKIKYEIENNTLIKESIISEEEHNIYKFSYKNDKDIS